MCKKVLVSVVLSLALSSACWSQDVPDGGPTLTPKQRALQLLDSLEQNNNEVLTSLDQSQTELTEQLRQLDALKDSLKKTVSYSESLEQSLLFSQMINNFALPIGGMAVVVAVVEGVMLSVRR